MVNISVVLANHDILLDIWRPTLYKCKVSGSSVQKKVQKYGNSKKIGFH